MVQTSLIGTVAILAGVVFIVLGLDIGLGLRLRRAKRLSDQP
jgi:hypothetical protein